MITLGLWFVVVFLLGAFAGLMVAMTLQAAMAGRYRASDDRDNAVAAGLSAGPPPPRPFHIVGDSEQWGASPCTAGPQPPRVQVNNIVVMAQPPRDRRAAVVVYRRG